MTTLKDAMTRVSAGLDKTATDAYAQGANAAAEHYKVAAAPTGVMAALGRGMRGAGSWVSKNPQQLMRLGGAAALGTAGAVAGSQASDQHPGLGAGLGAAGGIAAGLAGGSALGGVRGARNAVRGMGTDLAQFGRQTLRAAR